MVYGSKVQSYQIFKINSPSNPDDNTNVEYQAWGTWEGYNGIPQPIPALTGTNNLWFKQLGSIGAGFDHPIWTTDYGLANQWNIPYSKNGVTIEEAKALEEANTRQRELEQQAAKEAMIRSPTATFAGVTDPSLGKIIASPERDPDRYPDLEKVMKETESAPLSNTKLLIAAAAAVIALIAGALYFIFGRKK